MKRGLAGRIAQAFINSRLTPLLIVASLVLGVFAILETPREEDPQIVVPMLDIFVSMPGASAQEVEQRVSIPMEKLLAEIPDAKYVYSTSMPGSGSSAAISPSSRARPTTLSMPSTSHACARSRSNSGFGMPAQNDTASAAVAAATASAR